ncbi:hypothetical protein GCM10017674_59480 [Streptomyces gardneri]|uniref:Macro domain-containing protein n=1 Tax=Streptomyces gardneri TaxID=66892 RepID=A0A4Y3RNF3_9ACTN|nr:hypothetical protein SGA01_29750 [Streptomyces gardneri]GHH12923.1 hypothetical protein GCM10017674_59480 [Streptomyces gardneri]
MDGRQHVSPGQVLVSETGELLESHQVRRIVHVAAAEGEPGSGCRQVMESNRCVRDILAEIDRIAEVGESLRSLVLPLLGTGGDNSDLHRTVDTLLSAIVSYFEAHPASRIRAGSFLRIIGPCVSLTGAQWARIEPLLPDRTPRRTALQGGAGGGGLAVRLQIGRGSSPQWSPSRRRGHAGTRGGFGRSTSQPMPSTTPLVDRPSARAHPTTGSTTAGPVHYDTSPELCAALPAHIQAAQPDIAAPIRDGSHRTRRCRRYGRRI